MRTNCSQIHMKIWITRQAKLRLTIHASPIKVLGRKCRVALLQMKSELVKNAIKTKKRYCRASSSGRLASTYAISAQPAETTNGGGSR